MLDELPRLSTAGGLAEKPHVKRELHPSLSLSPLRLRPYKQRLEKEALLRKGSDLKKHIRQMGSTIDAGSLDWVRQRRKQVDIELEENKQRQRDIIPAKVVSTPAYILAFLADGLQPPRPSKPKPSPVRRSSSLASLGELQLPRSSTPPGTRQSLHRNSVDGAKPPRLVRSLSVFSAYSKVTRSSEEDAGGPRDRQERKKDNLLGKLELEIGMVDMGAAWCTVSSDESEEEHKGVVEPVMTKRNTIETGSLSAGKVRNVFKKFATSWEMPSESIPRALRMLGHHTPKQEWIDAFVNEKLRGRKTIDRYDFFALVSAYEEKNTDKMKQLFATMDVDYSGSLNYAEVSKLLRELGITPNERATQDIILEVTEKSITFVKVEYSNFLKLYDIIRYRAGFTRSETQRLRTVFNRYDYTHRGKLTAQELLWSMLWMGFLASETKVKALLVRADADSNLIDWDEFLQFLRIFREDEVRDVLEAFSREDDREGEVKLALVDPIFHHLGYRAARPKVLRECAQNVGVAYKDKLLFEDICSLLDEFRTVDGFSKDEHEAIRKVFEEFAHNLNDRVTISGQRLSRALHYLGYPHCKDELIKASMVYDMDCDGMLELEAFTKLVRSFMLVNVDKIRAAMVYSDLDGNGKLAAKEVRYLLLKMGYVPGKGDVAKYVEGDTELDVWRAIEVVDKFREVQAKKVRENHGYTDIEMKKMRAKFNEIDTDRSGRIDRSESTALVRALFPNAERDKDLHEKAMTLIADADTDHDGTLSLREFTLLVREVADDAELRMMAREKEALAVVNFTREELIAFRKIFRFYDHESGGEMSHFEIQKVLEGVVPVKEGAAGEIAEALEVTSEDGTRAMDFPEFLHLLSELQAHGWSRGRMHEARSNALKEK